MNTKNGHFIFRSYGWSSSVTFSQKPFVVSTCTSNKLRIINGLELALRRVGLGPAVSAAEPGLCDTCRQTFFASLVLQRHFVHSLLNI